jgi:PAS domain-containing protein
VNGEGVEKGDIKGRIAVRMAASALLLAQSIILALSIIPLRADPSQHGSKDEAVAMVQRVEDMFNEEGAAATFKAVSDPSTKTFHDRDLYPFIYDLSGVCVAHGARPALIGKNLIDIKDQRMVEAIEVFRKNIIDRHAMEQTLTEAIEAISEGFALYDADDRIAVCNTRYREMFSYGHETMVGTPFQTIVANAVGLIEDAQSDPARWIAERVAAHRNPGGFASASGALRQAAWWRLTETSPNSSTGRRSWTISYMRLPCSRSRSRSSGR